MYDGCAGGVDWMVNPNERALFTQDTLQITQSEINFLYISPEFLFASDLFRGLYIKIKEIVYSCDICSTRVIKKLCFTGEVLDQFDLDVFLLSLKRSMAAWSGRSNLSKISIEYMAKILLKRNTIKNRKIIFNSLMRLEKAIIFLKDERYTCSTRLIHKLLFDSEGKSCVVEMNYDIMVSLSRGNKMRSFIDERFRLPMSAFDRWLHGFLTFSPELCVCFEGIKKFSGNVDIEYDLLRESMQRIDGMTRIRGVRLLPDLGLEVYELG